jgi:protocatechuate 3,4-dioxygenase beta subunit
MELYLTRRYAVRIAAGIAASPLLSAFEHDPTHAVSEGPAYKPGAPVRRDIVDPGSAGTRFLLRGRVLSSATEKPVAEATLDLWNVQNNGQYDFKGFNLRGRQLTAGQGDFEFLTIEAIPYGSRTAHFHFKVSAPGFEPLTTELYLPGLAQNQRDSSFRTSNVLQVETGSGIHKGRYDFYLRPA